MRTTNNICVFDIKNVQEEYAYVLEFIECCEREDIYFENIQKKIGTIAEKITIKVQLINVNR